MKRYEHALEMLKLNKKDDVLEFGCGTGYQIPEITNRCKSYTGIDFSKKSLKLCKKMRNNKLLISDAHKIPFKKNSFNVILMIDILNNLYKPEKVLEEVKRVLKNNGKIIISVPNWYSFYGLTKFLLEKLKIWKYEITPPIDNWYTPSLIISIIKSKGLKIEEIRGSFFLPPIFTGNFYLIPALKIIPKIYDKFEIILSRLFKYFGYHIILCCSKIK
jgi:ubiquinone/menaquinone biosynthesis C-methylase UbiE